VLRVCVPLTILLLAFSPPAEAKCCALVTPVAPRELEVGEVWTAVIGIKGDRDYWRTDERLTVIAWSEKPGRYVSAVAPPTKRPGTYEVRVVFPAPGVWSYTVTVGGFAGSASAPLRRVTVVPRKAGARLGGAFVPAAVAAGAVLVLGAGLRRRYVRAGSTTSITS
jgi:hypothetical protein